MLFKKKQYFCCYTYLGFQLTVSFHAVFMCEYWRWCWQSLSSQRTVLLLSFPFYHHISHKPSAMELLISGAENVIQFYVPTSLLITVPQASLHCAVCIFVFMQIRKHCHSLFSMSFNPLFPSNYAVLLLFFR